MYKIHFLGNGTTLMGINNEQSLIWLLIIVVEM